MNGSREPCARTNLVNKPCSRKIAVRRYDNLRRFYCVFVSCRRSSTCCRFILNTWLSPAFCFHHNFRCDHTLLPPPIALTLMEPATINSRTCTQTSKSNSRLTTPKQNSLLPPASGVKQGDNLAPILFIFAIISKQLLTQQCTVTGQPPNHHWNGSQKQKATYPEDATTKRNSQNHSTSQMPSMRMTLPLSSCPSQNSSLEPNLSKTLFNDSD